VKLSEETFSILRCLSCNLIFPIRISKNDFFKKYYPRNYYHSKKNLFNFLQAVYQFFYYGGWKFSLNSYLKKGKVLDFGCGQGRFLACLPKAFIKYGVEINPQAVGYIKKNFPQIKIFKNLSSVRTRTLKFNLVTLWHVLEHLDKPPKTLEQLANLLEKDGWLILSTPNSQSLGFKIGQKHWFHLDVPRHLAIYNSDNLVKLCDKVGLKVVKIKGNWLEFPLDLFWSVYNRFKTESAGFNFVIGLFFLPVSLVIKLACSALPRKAETITIVCRKN